MGHWVQDVLPDSISDVESFLFVSRKEDLVIVSKESLLQF